MTTLVLLHAFPLDATMYEEVATEFDGDLVTPDLPGFGGAPLPEAEPSLDVYADYVARQLDAAELDRVVIGGTSMGGYTAMAFCRRHGDRVAGLALIDTKATADPDDGADGRRAMAKVMAEARTTEPLLANVFPKLLGATTLRGRPDVVQQVRDWVQTTDPDAAAYAQRAMAVRPDSVEMLAALSVPSLVVVGEEDVLTPPTDAAVMAAALHGAVVVEIPRVGHLTPVEAPHYVAEALTELVQLVDA
ncbi:MAG TPA: alpha/beta hydrolase [Actinomycetes bacterium]|nr:alpha/beta hydrolase [Actinomycetes bacterium]